MAKTKKKSTKQSAEELAILLAEVRSRMAQDKTLNDALTADFKKALIREGVSEAGNYQLTKATTFKVVTPELAIPFALERNLVKIDTGAVHDVFRMDEKLRFEDPSRFGFESVLQERVVPIKTRDILID